MARTPSMASLLRKHFSNLEEYKNYAKQPLPKKDKTYERGLIPGLFEALSNYKTPSTLKPNYRTGNTDITSKLGIQTYDILPTRTIDYHAMMTDHARQPTYVASTQNYQ